MSGKWKPALLQFARSHAAYKHDGDSRARPHIELYLGQLLRVPCSYTPHDAEPGRRSTREPVYTWNRASSLSLCCCEPLWKNTDTAGHCICHGKPVSGTVAAINHFLNLAIRFTISRCAVAAVSVNSLPKRSVRPSNICCIVSTLSRVWSVGQKELPPWCAIQSIIPSRPPHNRPRRISSYIHVHALSVSLSSGTGSVCTPPACMPPGKRCGVVFATPSISFQAHGDFDASVTV